MAMRTWSRIASGVVHFRLRRVVVLTAFVAMNLAGAAPVLADCQGGPVWPTVDRVRGTTFVGVFLGATANAEGDETYHWTVERVYAGELDRGRLDGWGVGKPSCHPTTYREGVRYLVSSVYPRGATAFDTVAYEVLDRGRVRIAPYPMQPRSSAPAIYHVDTLTEALDLLVPRLPSTDATFADSGSDASRGPFLGLLFLGSLSVVLAVGPLSRGRVRRG